jgi:hypothetical protein
MTFRFRLIALGLLCLTTPLLRALVVVPLSINDLTAKAALIVQGTVVSQSCQRDAEGRIYTKVELRIADVWKGTPSSNPLAIVHGGGILGEERVVVSGQVSYHIGEEVVAFLVINPRGEAVTLGLAQGKFRISKDSVTGKSFVHNPFHGGPPAAQPASVPSTSPARLTLDDLKGRVKGERP